jgi:SulP family sulfate permease
LLGGSRFQVGGPAGAFIVLVAQTVQNHGLDGVVLATMMAGVFLIAAGFLRLGTYVKFIPYPVTVGFTAGIAVIIFASQIKDLLGLTLAGHEPAAFLPKLAALGGAIGTINPSAVALAAVTIAVMVALRILRPSWPGILIGVAVATVAASMLGLPVETIGSRFGGIPESLPAPVLPAFSLQKMQAVLPDAIAFALLGSIESLLSAVVADGMTGRRHRSNCELVAQGVGNMASALFGGICVTGLIARTATNIRAGARSPVAGIMHSAFVLLFILIAAPLASYVPLSALAAVLVVVAWTMAEKQEFALLVRSSWGDAAVLLATFLLTVFRDLTEGIVVGFALGAMLFIHRMASATAIESGAPLELDDKADTSNGDRVPYDPALATDPDVIVYRISGAFFFGAASTIGAVLDRIPSGHKGLVIDFAAVPLLDSSAANVIARVAEKARHQGVRVFLTGAAPQVRRELLIHGARPPVVRYRSDISSAVDEIKRKAALTASAAA